MRVAVVSDVHGNLTALEAVIADLRETAPDLVLNGGDLPQGGARPMEVLDRVRDLGWPGVLGNTDEMLFDPDSLRQFAAQSPAPYRPMFDLIEEMAEATRALLGTERLAWLQALPRRQIHGELALVHAAPDTTWRAPGPEASDAEVSAVYKGLGLPLVVYGHIHRPYIRNLSGMTVANSGSTGMPYDGDRRASYLLVEDGRPEIRRVEYDVEREVQMLAECKLPHGDWVARMLRNADPVAP